MFERRDPHQLYLHDHLLGATVVRLVPRFVTPNMITVFRFAATPFVLWLLLTQRFGLGLVAFVLVAFTDALDGSVARIRRKVTAWGTFYDPVADKLLIGSVVLLVVLPRLPFELALAIVGFEIAITVGAAVGRRKGRLISANGFGKTKMFLQVVGVSLALLSLAAPTIPEALTIAVGILWMSVAFAFVSLVTYGL
ncbi:CDP-alcohol phosphatidyltransferase family protein [Patescibacteria group bacterium]|nr:MAG: CDP-alcohol phosphatidyltransferase family protein [Patescibacteria group bacterium]